MRSPGERRQRGDTGTSAAGRAAFFAVAGSVALGVVTALHVYLGLRLLAAPPWETAVSGWGTAVLVALGLSIPLAFVGERLVPPPLGRALVWPGAVWMGMAWLLLTVTGLSDLGLALAGAFEDPALLRGRAAIGLGLAGLVAIAGLRAALRVPAVRSVAVYLPNWPAELSGYRFAQISDLHVGPLLGARWLEGVVRRVNALEVDCVVVTGDLVDGPAAHFAPAIEPLRGLRARHGAWCITGNHEMYSGPRAWLREFERVGLQVLENRHVTLGDGGAAFDLAGTHDRQGEIAALPEDLDAALVGRDPSRPVVLLAHTPTTFPDAAERGVDLTLSGHTHGGQMWPFGFLVKLALGYVAGLYRRGPSQLYVSRGTGFWGPPMRLGAPAEITEITLHPAAQAERHEDA